MRKLIDQWLNNHDNPRHKTMITWMWRLLFGGLIAFVMLFIGLSFTNLPSVAELENPKTNLASQVFAENGEILGKYYTENRVPVEYEELPEHLVQALIATEDIRYYEHSGIDFYGLVRAVAFVGTRGGASTITQQVAKNVFLWQGGSYDKYIRKIPEIYFTFLIELIWGKKRILEVYLNVIETGPGCFGMEAAARHYFNKSAKSLTPAQAAMIVAGFPNPKKFTASPMSKRVSWRYPQILRQMSNIDTDEDIYSLLHKK